MAALFGPFMVLVFCLSQAFRDVYFANIFQGLDFFAVIAIAFGLSAVIFGALTAARSPGDLAKLRDGVGSISYCFAPIADFRETGLGDALHAQSEWRHRGAAERRRQPPAALAPSHERADRSTRPGPKWSSGSGAPAFKV
jgi:hypothetical protein